MRNLFASPETQSPEIETVKQAAEEWYAELPLEIQQPIDRGGPAVVWTSSSERVKTADLIRLSDDDMRKYERIVDCTNYYLANVA